MSHTALTYHIIIGTYKRHPSITLKYDRLLYRFIYEYLTKRNIFVRRIGGMPDHLHILCDIPAKYALADTIRNLKAESSKYLRHSPHFPLWEKWATGYGAFTIDTSQSEGCRQYIINQKLHHRGIDFEAEYRDMLHTAGIPDDTDILGEDNNTSANNNHP